MPFYHKLGELPPVKHTTFYKPDGTSLYREELVSSKGFSGIYSTVYHHELPNSMKAYKDLKLASAELWTEAPTLYMHSDTDKHKESGNFVTARRTYLENAGCKISIAHVDEDSEIFYRNVRAAEFIFIHHGAGVLYSQFGKNPFGPGDQIVVPRGTIYRMSFEDLDQVKLVIVESDTAFEIPKHYKNDNGQMAEHAPYCERDFRPPEYTEPILEKGEYPLILKADDRYTEHTLVNHPFDVVGWDGYLYPFTFNIKNFHPKVGRIHLPPPVHLLYTTASFVVCNFVPRPFDFHEKAIPAPYFHNNIDSDEVLYYLDGDFMSRKGVVSGSLTFHPGGITHGPQPGRTEDSIGVEKTEEYALMIDTFSPLKPTTALQASLLDDYYRSWMPND
ncbi:MAG: homogentisate 1,2-dioxygenase [Candidatus Marinimicrobia bacterium]|nr:homogentisate 1,2-dioxygenase [Candidatus Neomarinimicrobiota bacterium]MCF7904177.1 homogentisate 1,2-dioxygenase [Candidatus Neomarinimicrobiota bacterium]